MRWVRNPYLFSPHITTAGQGEKSYGYTLPLAAIFTLTYTACILGLSSRYHYPTPSAHCSISKERLCLVYP